MTDYNWMDEAQQVVAAIFQRDDDPKPAIEKHLACWMRTVAHNQRNTDYYRGLTDYYRGLVEQCGIHIGADACTADGSIMTDVLCAKVPELVEKLVDENAELKENIDELEAKLEAANRVVMAVKKHADEFDRIHFGSLRDRWGIAEALKQLEELKDVMPETLLDKNGIPFKNGDFILWNPDDDSWIDVVVSKNGVITTVHELGGGEMKLKDGAHSSSNPCLIVGNIMTHHVELTNYEDL